MRCPPDILDNSFCLFILQFGCLLSKLKKAIEDITNGISNTSDNLKNAEITSIYSANGTRKAQLTKGINIVKMSNGAVKKILVK